MGHRCNSSNKRLVNTLKVMDKSRRALQKMVWKANSKTMIRKRLRRAKKEVPRDTTMSTAMRSLRKRSKLTCSSSKNSRSSMEKKSTGRKSKKTVEAMNIDA